MFTTLVAAVTAAVGFYAGHKTQILTLIKIAEEMGPDVAAVLRQIRSQAKAK